jgi:hypothetical protein
MLAMVDFVFEHIKESEAEVVADDSLSLPEKIQKILGVMPEAYSNLDFTQFYSLQDKYPEVYERIREHLESGWEATIALLEEGRNQGLVRPTNFQVFQITFEAATERFLMGDELEKNGISYMEALDELVSILVDGILVR